MLKRLLRPVFLVFLALLTSATLGGCRQSAQPTPASDLTIALEAPAAPHRVGKTTLIILVRDTNDRPVNDAQIEVTGDMTHAGMQPVFGKATGGKDGKYEVPFEWTMGGDWFLTVKVTLPDGRAASQRFDLSVSSQ